MIGKILKLISSRLTLVLGALAAVGVLAAVVAAQMWLSARDDLVEARMAASMQKALIEAREKDLKRLEKRVADGERVRIALQDELREIEARPVETNIEIREVWRDREVVVERPVAVQCAREPLPGRVLRLLCDTDRRGACADMRTPAG